MKLILRFFKLAFIIILGVSLSYILTSCKSDTGVEPGIVSGDILTVLPQVTISGADYNAGSLFSYMTGSEIHSRFKKEYKDRYCESLKESIEGYIEIELEKKGEDALKFVECYNTLPHSNAGKCLPCLVESAKFNGKECFLVLFNWGMAEGDLGHYAYYAIDKSTKEILNGASCR